MDKADLDLLQDQAKDARMILQDLEKVLQNLNAKLNEIEERNA